MADRLRARYGVLGSGPRFPDITSDSWAIDAYRVARARGPWDLVVSTSSPYATHVLASRLRRTGRASAWLADYRDLWTDHHALPGLPAVRLVERVIERRVLQAADVVTTVSAPLAERLRRQLMTKDVHVIENGVDPDDFAPLDPEPIFPRDGRVRLVYTGSIHPQQNVDAFFEALAVLARRGDSDIDRLDVQIATWTASYVRARAGRAGAAHLVTIRDAVPRDEALRMQRDADFLIFLPWADRAETGVLTGKVFEYICSGTPILMMGCDHLESAQRLVLDEGRGVRLPDAASIASFLSATLNGASHVPPRRAPGIADRYSRPRLADRLLDLAFVPS